MNMLHTMGKKECGLNPGGCLDDLNISLSDDKGIQVVPSRRAT